MKSIELRKLRELSQLFEKGKATNKEIQELSNLLSLLNKYNTSEEELNEVIDPF